MISFPKSLVFAVALFAASIACAQQVPPNYQLASGDVIKVTVFQNPEMTLDTRVSEDGMINYPLVGRIPVDTDIGVAEKRIGKALKDGGFLKDPQINIQLIEVHGNLISVLGQVVHAGSFPLLTTTRISQALAQAGGITVTGDDRVIVTGTRDGRPYRQEVDLDALYRENADSADLVLAAGDAVYVPRAPMFYIYGEILKPGNYRIDRNMTMRQALAAGGGLTLRGTERRLKVVRNDAAGKPQKISVELEDPVQPGDTLYVAESLF